MLVFQTPLQTHHIGRSGVGARELFNTYANPCTPSYFPMNGHLGEVPYQVISQAHPAPITC